MQQLAGFIILAPETDVKAGEVGGRVCEVGCEFDGFAVGLLGVGEFADGFKDEAEIVTGLR